MSDLKKLQKKLDDENTKYLKEKEDKDYEMLLMQQELDRAQKAQSEMEQKKWIQEK